MCKERGEPKVNKPSSDRIRQRHRPDKLAIKAANTHRPILPSDAQQDDKMAPGQKMYPRATVKKIVKAHSNCNISKNADVTVSWTPKEPDAFWSRYALTLTSGDTQMFLDYIIFMQTCAATHTTTDLHEFND